MASRVFMIVDAYESGVGHGIQNDGMAKGQEYFSDPEHAEAYNLGYEKGQEIRAGRVAHELDMQALISGCEALVDKPKSPESREAINLILRIFKEKGKDDSPNEE